MHRKRWGPRSPRVVCCRVSETHTSATLHRAIRDLAARRWATQRWAIRPSPIQDFATCDWVSQLFRIHNSETPRWTILDLAAPHSTIQPSQSHDLGYDPRSATHLLARDSVTADLVSAASACLSALSF